MNTAERFVKRTLVCETCGETVIRLSYYADSSGEPEPTKPYHLYTPVTAHDIIHVIQKGLSHD